MPQDFRYALRQLWRNRGFALAAIASLALGIGATTAVFSAIDGILWSPYPYRGVDRMVILSSSHKSAPPGRMFMTTDEFRDSIMQASSLDGGILWDNWPMSAKIDSAKAGGLPESVRAGKLSPNAFPFLGVSPLIGRSFTGSAFKLASDRNLPVVLSYRFWQSRFGGSQNVLGRVLQLDQQDYTVIGVMPDRFRFQNAEVYVPLTKPGGPYFVMARVGPGVARSAAASELQTLIRHDAQQEGDPDWQDVRVQLTSMRDDAVGSSTTILGVLFGAVSLLPVIGCANVSILLVARGMERQQESAVRGAIGASGSRILRQLLTESLVLSIIGTAAGIAAGYGLLAAILHFMPENLIPHADILIRISLPVLACATIVALLAGVAAGISPAFRFSRLNFSFQAHGGLGGLTGRRAHSLLMLGQIALTIVLLAGAGAALQTYLHLTAAQLGYDPHDVTTLELTLPDGAFPKWQERIAYYDHLRASIASVPGVESVAIATEVPPDVPGRSRIEIPGQQLSENERVVPQRVSSEYFSALRIPLLRGRFWTRIEEMRPAHVAVISEAMARRYWPDADPLGRRVRLGDLKKFSIFQPDSPGNDQWVGIIGVAGDVRNIGLHDASLPAIYTPYTVLTGDGFTLAVRAKGSQAAIVRAARRQIASVNGEQPVNRVSSLEELLKAAGWARQEFVASLFLLCAGLALLLAALGLHSVVACSVSRRSREFALRIALGASRAHIFSIVFRSIGVVLSLGFLCGLALTAMLDRPIARWTESSLWNLDSLGPAILALGLIGLAAIFIPARRAASSDPMDVMRGG